MLVPVQLEAILTLFDWHFGIVQNACMGPALLNTTVA
jgi:hypothetical protein